MNVFRSLSLLVDVLFFSWDLYSIGLAYSLLLIAPEIPALLSIISCFMFTGLGVWGLSPPSHKLLKWKVSCLWSRSLRFFFSLSNLNGTVASPNHSTVTNLMLSLRLVILVIRCNYIS